jgi:hypothetical protein
VTPYFVASYGWAGSRADDWVNEFLASNLGKSNLAKLARAAADERHLVILMYPDRTAAGRCRGTGRLARRRRQWRLARR